MRYAAAIGLLILLLLASAQVFAQDSPTATPVEQALLDLVNRAEAAALKAEEQAQRARQYSDSSINLAASLLGLFEAVTGVAGLILPALAIVAGFVGLNRLNSAQRDLEEARKRVEADLTAAL